MDSAESTAFEEFRQIVLVSDDLQRELCDVTDKDDFVARVVELAADHDLTFSKEVVVEALRVARKEWIERSI